jgi:hypothetical protein
MRSKLIYSAENQVHDEFLLASLAIRATRRLRSHDATRTEDRMNEAFRILGQPSDPEKRENQKLPAHGSAVPALPAAQTDK